MKTLLLPVLLAVWPAQSDDQAAKSDRARRAMAAKRFDQATELYRQLVRDFPDNLGLSMNLGLALHSAARYREAVEQFEIVRERQPEFGPAYLLLGVSYLKLGEPEPALEHLRKAFELRPADRLVCLELADAYLSLGRLQEAAAQFQTLVGLAPESPKAWQGLGISFASLSRRTLAELERTEPDSPWTYMLLGRARLEEGRYKSAFSLYHRALERKPDLPGIHAALAEIYRKTGHPQWAALQEAREAAQPAPPCPAQTAECEFRAGRYRAALRLAEKQTTPHALYWRTRSYGELAREALVELATLPPSAETHAMLAEALGLEQRHAESAVHWRKALQYASGDSRVEFELARSLWLCQDYEKALPLLRKLAKRPDSRADLQYLLGDTVLRLQGAQKALGLLEAAARSNPNLLPARAALGRALIETGQAVKAIPHLEAALSADRDGDTFVQLSRAYKLAGREEHARQILERYQQFIGERGTPEREITEP